MKKKKNWKKETKHRDNSSVPGSVRQILTGKGFGREIVGHRLQNLTSQDCRLTESYFDANFGDSSLFFFS